LSEYLGAWKPGTSATFVLGAESLAVACATELVLARTAAAAIRQAASDARTAFLTRRTSLPLVPTGTGSV
jgi:hypothetical protein